MVANHVSYGCLRMVDYGNTQCIVNLYNWRMVMVVNHGIWGEYPVANPELVNRWTWKVRTKSLMHSFLPFLREGNPSASFPAFHLDRLLWQAHLDCSPEWSVLLGTQMCWQPPGITGSQGGARQTRLTPITMACWAHFVQGPGLGLYTGASWESLREHQAACKAEQCPVHLWFMLEYGLVPCNSAIPSHCFDVDYGWLWRIQYWNPPSNTKKGRSP